MKLRKVFAVAAYDFRQWRRNPRIVLCFCLAFILCFLLSDKAVRFSQTYGSIMQILEPFIWTFGDANSILLSSLLLILLFADMPFISAGTPFMLLRIDRKTWVLGQALYIVAATTVYLLFVLLSTSFICQSRSFLGNQWSETAAILGYSGAGQAVALPALVKTLELSLPYACTAWIFALMLLYTLLLMFLMLSLRAAWRRDRRVGLLALRLSLKPQDNSNDLSDPRRMDVQGQCGGGLALAAEPGHLSHAQLWL